MTSIYGSSPAQRQILHSNHPSLHQIVEPPTQIIIPGHVQPPMSNTRSFYYPPCPQYAGYSPGSIIQQGGVIYGNCSPNTNNDPFAAPYDFQCRNGTCVGTNGVSGYSPDQVCCPPANVVIVPPAWWPMPVPYQPRPFPHRRRDDCCSHKDVNACAICLDNKQGLSTKDSAGHFANMNRCQNNCPQNLLY